MDSDFRRKNDAQFARAKAALQNLGREYIVLLATDITEGTPGFGNQAPADTQYIPTGRLRGGWNWTRDPIGTSSKGLFATRGEEGPFSDYGRETIDRIREQVAEAKVGGISYLENDVGYGILIVRGEANHAAVGPRNWPRDTYLRQTSIARVAMQRAGFSK